MYAQLNPSRRVLMGPGPSDIHPRVLASMSMPMIGHLDPEFVEIMDDIKVMLKEALATSNNMTYVISGPGTTGMESAMCNLLETGDTAVVCVHGIFGDRMAEMARRTGADVVVVEAPWGEPIEPGHVRRALAGRQVKVVSIVHAETSTGVLQPLQEISSIAQDAGALFVVDAVSSFCGTELPMDDWGIDVIYSGSQKCLSAPPGLSPTSFSDRAVEAVQNRKTPVQSWFLDVSLIASYWSGQKRAYHHTAPISGLYAFREALRLVHEEGLANRFERHKHNVSLLRNGLEDLGIEIQVAPQYRLPMLTVAKVPDQLDDVATRQQLLNEYNIEISGGLGKFAGQVWRIGLMGESSTQNNVHILLGALAEILKS